MIDAGEFLDVNRFFFMLASLEDMPSDDETEASGPPDSLSERGAPAGGDKPEPLGRGRAWDGAAAVQPLSMRLSPGGGGGGGAGGDSGASDDDWGNEVFEIVSPEVCAGH